MHIEFGDITISWSVRPYRQREQDLSKSVMTREFKLPCAGLLSHYTCYIYLVGY